MATYTLTPQQLKGAGIYNSFEIPAGGGTPPFSNTKSILLDGVDDEVSMDFTNTSTTGSISVWIKPTDYTTGIQIVWLYVGSGYRDLIALGQRNDGTLSFSAADGGSTRWRVETDNAVVSNGAWTHVVFSFDGSNGTIYINGSIVPQTYTNTTNKSWWWDDLIPTKQRLGILRVNGYSAQQRYNGNIEEQSVFSSALSSTEVNAIYNNGLPTDLSSESNILAWYRMGDGDTAPTLTDNIGSNDGTMSNFSTFSTDVPPNPFVNTKSILLDGVDDYVDTSTYFGVPPIDRYNKDTFSVSVWIKVDASQTVNWQYYTPISATTNGSNVGLVTRKFGNATGHVVYSNPNNGTTQLDDGNWHHLLGVFIASTNNWRVFVDGNSTPEINQTIASWQFFDKNVKIGQQGNQTNYFVGNVDECAYWLSDESANLATIYNSGVPNDISSLSPVSWWRCGDGDTSPRLTDNGSASNDGTMTNFRTFSTDVPT